jgi:hypothetical protein
MHAIAFQPINPPSPTIQELCSIFSCHSNMAWNVTKVKKYTQISCPTFVNIRIHFDINITLCNEIPLSSRTAPSRPGGDIICGLFLCSNRRSVTSTTQKGATKDCNRQTVIFMLEVWDRKSANYVLSSTIKVVFYDLFYVVMVGFIYVLSCLLTPLFTKKKLKQTIIHCLLSFCHTQYAPH